MNPKYKARWYFWALLVGAIIFWIMFHKSFPLLPGTQWHAQPVVPTVSKFFDPATVRVGDDIAGMLVTEIGPAREDLPLSFNPFFKENYDPAKPVMNYQILFQGSRIVEGLADPSTDAKGNFNGWKLYVSLSNYLPLDQNLMDPQQSAFGIHINGNSSLLPTDRSSEVRVELQNFKIRAYVDNDFTDGYSADIKDALSFTPIPPPDKKAYDYP